MYSYLFEAFLLGLSVGPVCLAYCAPALVPFITAEKKDKFSGTIRLLSLFLFGRLTGYITIGLITGLVGNAVSDYGRSSLSAIITMLMGIILLIFGLVKNFPKLKWCHLWGGKKSSVIFAPALGFLTGLSICPPFIAAITSAATIGTIQGAMFYFMAFFIGTALYIPPMIIFGPLSKIKAVRNVAKVCLILSGTWFIVRGIMALMINIHIN